MKSCLTKFKSFQRKSVQIEALQKYIANFYTSPLFWVEFEELPFCHFPPPNNSIRGKDSNFLVDLSYQYRSFLNKRTTKHTLFHSSHISATAHYKKKHSKQECFIGSKTTRLRLVVLNPIKHSCSAFKHFITLNPVQTMDVLHCRGELNCNLVRLQRSRKNNSDSAVVPALHQNQNWLTLRNNSAPNFPSESNLAKIH